MPQYRVIKEEINQEDMFKKTGLFPSYKYGLSKILWLKKRGIKINEDIVWLSIADYITYRLTGDIGTDYSLAARTYLFRIDSRQWYTEWINNFGLKKNNFPPVYPAGTTIGMTNNLAGIKSGIPVSIAGHDHVCAALAVGAIRPGIVYDSIGTAETLMGTMEEFTPGKQEYNSGLSFGCHVLKDKYFWMGGLSASGGSIEWFSKIIGETITYEKINESAS